MVKNKKKQPPRAILRKKGVLHQWFKSFKYTCLEYTYLVHATLLEINSFTTSFKGFRSQVQYSYSTEQLSLEQLIFWEYLSLLLKIIRQANHLLKIYQLDSPISLFLQNKGCICFLELKSSELTIYTELLVKLNLVRFLLIFSQ